MRQVTMPVYGGPEVLTMADAPEPEPGPGELLVRVRAAGVNRADCLQRAGTYPDAARSRQRARASRLPGEVAGVGVGVESFRGRRPGVRPRRGGRIRGVRAPRRATRGSDSGRTGASCRGGGGHRSLLHRQRDRIRAWRTSAEDRPLLVHAGASGVGTAAVQMAKQAGATVHFTAGSRSEDRPRARRSGPTTGSSTRRRTSWRRCCG